MMFLSYLSMAHVDERIEEFLMEIKDLLEQMTQDEFDTLVSWQSKQKHTKKNPTYVSVFGFGFEN